MIDVYVRLVLMYIHVVCVCQFISCFFYFSHCASQAVGAGSNYGGRELVRAVSLGDVNMAMLSWHRT